MSKQLRGRRGDRHEAIDTTSWLTRNEVADTLRCSVNTVRSLEARGKLHPMIVRRPDIRGREHRVSVYDPRELPSLPSWTGRVVQRDTGEVAARCFEFFEQGQTPREIVVQLRENPDVVMMLREKWLDMGGADLVLTQEARKELEAMLGQFTTVAELVDRIKGMRAPTSTAMRAVTWAAVHDVDGESVTWHATRHAVQLDAFSAVIAPETFMLLCAAEMSRHLVRRTAELEPKLYGQDRYCAACRAAS